MKISVFGLGYVACVSAAGFAARGHTIVGVDDNALKVRLIEAGQTPVLEAVGANREYVESQIPHLKALLADTSAEGMRHAEVCIVGSSTPEAIDALAQTNGRRVVDLVRLPDAVEPRGREDHVGVAW